MKKKIKIFIHRNNINEIKIGGKYNEFAVVIKIKLLKDNFNSMIGKMEKKLIKIKRAKTVKSGFVQ